MERNILKNKINIRKGRNYDGYDVFNWSNNMLYFGNNFLFVMADEQFGKSDSFVRCLMSIIFFVVFICCFIFNLYSIERQNKIKVTLYEGYKI